MRLESRQTATFAYWLSRLRDHGARDRVLLRIDRLERGNPGDNRFVGGGVREMRIDYGPGYRIFYMKQGDRAVLLLCGGDNRRQQRDIAHALVLAKEAGE